MRRLSHSLLLALAAMPGLAGAAEKKLFISSFERLRVEGPYEVTVVTGRSPSGSVSGDARQLAGIEVRSDGATVVVRPAIGGSDAGADGGPRIAASAPVKVTLSTPVLLGATVLGGGAVTVTGGRASRLDLAVSGAGSLQLTGADTDQVNAQVIGTGRVSVAGRARRARLLLNGAGRLEADRLEAGDLVLNLDGPGEATARARYTATVTSSGLGHATVLGTPKCTVRSAAGGVTCGVTR